MGKVDFDWDDLLYAVVLFICATVLLLLNVFVMDISNFGEQGIILKLMLLVAMCAMFIVISYTASTFLKKYYER